MKRPKFRSSAFTPTVTSHTRSDAPPAMDVATVIRARARMSHGKVSGDDSIVADMLEALPMIAVYLVSHIFAQ
eukprot:5584064-Alexandrium_andersonii.AAC.1